MDTRAQSIGIARLFLALAVVAVLFFILTEVMTPLLDYSYSGPVADEGKSYLTSARTFFPALGLGVSFFGIIAYAVFRRRAVR